MPLTSAGNPIGEPFIELQSVDSTNKYAMQLIQKSNLPGRQGGSLHGTAIFSHEQTAGKGQRGKKWSSEKGVSIALSIILNPQPLKLTAQFGLSVCAALSMRQMFSNYAGEETKIKWPNDLYWRDRKAGGVLIETVVRSQESVSKESFGGVANHSSRTPSKKSETNNLHPTTSYQNSTVSQWKWAVVGIGINVNQMFFPVDLPNPVSLKQITGINFDPVVLAKELCKFFEINYQLLLTGKLKSLFEIYQTHLYKKNEKVKFRKGSRVFETTIKGVSEKGQLVTQHAIEEKFDFGEVEWLI